MPYRIRGDLRQPVTDADRYVEPYGCPFVRNTFDQAVKGRYDFLDGVVMAHSCDSVQRMYGIWTHYRPTAFTHMVNVPHTVTPATERFFHRELGFFKEHVERFAGAPIDDGALEASIDLYNRNRALVWDLYQLRKTDPPRLSGAEMLEVLIAGGGLPAAEFGELLREVPSAHAGHHHIAEQEMHRFLMLLQQAQRVLAGGRLEHGVAGTLSFLGRVTNGGDPLAGFVRYYFTGFECPRTYRGTDRSRFDYLVHAARQFRAQGVVLYILSFCDPHKLDLVDVRRHLEGAGLPSLVLEDDYTLANLESMRTRIQAFVEMVG